MIHFAASKLKTVQKYLTKWKDHVEAGRKYL